MSHVENCPFCKCSLIGDEIPVDIRHHYGGTHWRREIGIYSRILDRTVAFRCPDCKRCWQHTRDGIREVNEKDIETLEALRLNGSP